MVKVWRRAGEDLCFEHSIFLHTLMIAEVASAAHLMSIKRRWFVVSTKVRSMIKLKSGSTMLCLTFDRSMQVRALEAACPLSSDSRYPKKISVLHFGLSRWTERTHSMCSCNVL